MKKALEGTRSTFRILCLDGGGAKGMYTLGILRALESEIGVPLHEFFDAIYGTSTGAIIAALIGLEKSAEEALELYRRYIPSILAPLLPSMKSRALRRTAEELFGQKDFSFFKTFIALIATNWTAEKPLIFKSSSAGAHGMKNSFVPGWGCTIAQAVEASCSASPFFQACHLDIGDGGRVEVRDGGFAANNPSLYAAFDAVNAFRRNREDVRLLSLGVGQYPEPKRTLVGKILRRSPSAHLLLKTLSVNASTTEIQFQMFCSGIRHLRISDTFADPNLAADFLECDRRKLDLMVQKGRESFAAREQTLKDLFDNYE